MNSRPLRLRALLLAVVLSPFTGLFGAESAEIEKLPQYTVEERKLSPWLLWSYARAGQCEVITDLGENAASTAVAEARMFLEVLHQAHPEAAIPRDRQIRLMLSSGRTPLFAVALKTAGRVMVGDTVGIYLEANEYDMRQMRLVRRELVKAGFGEKSAFPWWYRTGLKNVLAHVRIDGTTVLVGEPPLSGQGYRFMLTEQYLRPYEQVLRFDETSPEYSHAEVRWQMERQATALVHVSLFHRHGEYAPALMRFIRDERMTSQPDAAFEQAYGRPITSVGFLIRDVTDTVATPEYRYDFVKLTIPAVTLDETRGVRKADVERFRAVFGQE